MICRNDGNGGTILFSTGSVWFFVSYSFVVILILTVSLLSKEAFAVDAVHIVLFTLTLSDRCDTEQVK